MTGKMKEKVIGSLMTHYNMDWKEAAHIASFLEFNKFKIMDEAIKGVVEPIPAEYNVHVIGAFCSFLLQHAGGLSYPQALLVTQLALDGIEDYITKEDSPMEIELTNGDKLLLTAQYLDKTGKDITHEKRALFESLKWTPKKHYMRLKASPFTKIASGNKTIELRLLDEKRQDIDEGDEIEFINMENPKEKICVKVLALYKFQSFEELYRKLPLEQCGYAPEEIKEANHTDMNEYYSQEEQEKYGVVGIAFSVMEGRPEN